MLPRSSRDYYRHFSAHASVPETTYPSPIVNEESQARELGDDPSIRDQIMGDDITDGEALADFMAAFYGSRMEDLHHMEDDTDALNPEWVQLEKDGRTPLYDGAKVTRYHIVLLCENRTTCLWIFSLHYNIIYY